MPVQLTKWIQQSFRDHPEWATVSDLADRLLARLNAETTLTLIEAANRPTASSADVQEALRPVAESLGFQSERRGLFLDSIPGLRPDYYQWIDGSGIVLEVERGKTTTNNMDLLDFWKCHLCPSAHYLFLLVPQALRHNPDMTPKREFESVSRRLGTFFEPRNYTNVRGLCLFGY